MLELTLTAQTPFPVTAQTPIPRYDFDGPDRSAGLDTKEAPAIPHAGCRGFFNTCRTARDQMKLTFIAFALLTLLSSCSGHLPVGL